MKCKPYRGQEIEWAHVKRDGFQLRVSKDAFGRVVTSTRTQEVRVPLTGILLRVHECVPRGVTLLGELWYPGRKASAVSTAIAEQDCGLSFEGFAVETLPAETPLDVIEEYYLAWGIPFAPLCRDWPLVQRLVQGAEPLPSDWEGFVFKNGNMLDWFKWKPAKTIDLVVVDVKDGNGKYLGMVGSYVCALADGRVVANVSGMDDEQRYDFDVVGRVCEVEYQYVGAGGRLRHPRFVRWRPDKPAAECTADQDTDLSCEC